MDRVLEPELMDTPEDARAYDAMDHSNVNAQFVTDLLAVLTDWSLQRPVHSAPTVLNLLDLGAGTAQIPIELARRARYIHITAIDAAESMLTIARENVATATSLPCREGQGEGSSKQSLGDHIDLTLADAKNLPFASASFPVVISNSIFHHIPEPRTVVAEAVRVIAPGGILFHRDLARPNDETQLRHLVDTYAEGATPYQRKLFADSLHAALKLEEMQELVAAFGFARDTVQITSDRHWTWMGIYRS